MTAEPDSIRAAYRAFAEIQGSAESEDRFVAAIVGYDHDLRELWLDPRALRDRDAASLAARVLRTVQAATEDADRRAFGVAQPFLPPGTGFADVDLAFDPVLAEVERRARQ
ncbi:YbaB/EbfC family nucleoid-associated protein [Amycolatopsis silviterrae]|uniref:YbaB/EbfC family nucleoid-associated protein n=1 Tax=Amycolatopsis silviterrae TaxID=1656914 RepID=A0ABW5H4K7_9PSEU